MAAFYRFIYYIITYILRIYIYITYILLHIRQKQGLVFTRFLNFFNVYNGNLFHTRHALDSAE